MKYIVLQGRKGRYGQGGALVLPITDSLRNQVQTWKRMFEMTEEMEGNIVSIHLYASGGYMADPARTGWGTRLVDTAPEKRKNLEQFQVEVHWGGFSLQWDDDVRGIQEIPWRMVL